MDGTQGTGIWSKVGVLTKKIPFLHRFLVSVYHIAVLEVWPRLKKVSRPRKNQQNLAGDLANFLSLQDIRVLSLNLESPSIDGDLIASLKQNNIPFCVGGWTIYLPPSERLGELLPELKGYPVQSGVKILRHLEPPTSALYTPNHLRPTPGAASVRSRTPKPIELLRVAGVLANEGLGPLVHDLVELKIGNSRCTAFVTEHVPSEEKISSEEYGQFITKLDEILEKGILEIAHGDYRISKDFRKPDCNENLIKGLDGRCLYVDFQSFKFADEMNAFVAWADQNSDNLLFGPRRMGKDKNYLYQMIPGIGDAKRETLVRWEIIDALLEEGELDLHGRPTFDIGCNSGLMSYYALSRGAKWAYGWDHPEIASASQQLLRLLGASRWTVSGAKISQDTDFIKALPENAQNESKGVLLYLAVSNHFGFPEGLAKLPWRYCIYEGHSGQDMKSSIDKIKHSGWAEANNIKIIATRTVEDGDSPIRSLVLFSR